MPENENPGTSLPQEILAHYGETGYEARRLSGGTSRLEFARTKDIFQRYLPLPPSVILDVGGASGAYSCWLAKQKYEVHLIDAVPLHVDLARRASESQPDCPISSCAVGDARKLEWADESVDAVLLMGPLYHLTEQSDRISALREARRVLKPGGLAFCVVISRFASILDGLTRGYLDDPAFVEIVKRDLQDGQHRNPTNQSFYFTTAYFHHPEVLKREVEDAGLFHRKTLSIEGPGWLLQNFEEHWSNSGRRERLLNAIRSIEEEPSMLGVSAHMIAISQKIT